jgi:hypothetical protein
MAIRATPLGLTGLTLLGLVNAWLVAAVVADVVPDDEDHENIAEIVTPAKLEGSLDGASTSKAYDQILSRPIFFKSREPFIPPPPDATTSQSKANSAPVFADPGLVLGGVMISQTNRQAYLFQKSKPDGSWIREGEDFLGWKLEFLDQGDARLQKDGHTIDLHLYPIRQ